MNCLLKDVTRANSQYFAKGNKEFFNDISYHVMSGSTTGKSYLVTYTAKWSDMFDGKKKNVYVVKGIDENLKIVQGNVLLDDATKNELYEFLAKN